MSSVKRLIGAGIGTLILLAGGAMTAAPSASAAVGEKKCGVALNGVTVNTPLCLKSYSNGYEISYYNDTGQPRRLDFNLNCSTGRYGDLGSFWSFPGTTRTYFFEVGVKNWCQGGMYDYNATPTGGLWFWTNPIYR